MEYCDCGEATIPHGPLLEVAAEAGVELREGDGVLFPWHCGAQCEVGNGILGPDSVECKACGLTLGNILSPHINHGRVFAEAFYRRHDAPYGYAGWAVLKEPGGK